MLRQGRNNKKTANLKFGVNTEQASERSLQFKAHIQNPSCSPAAIGIIFAKTFSEKERVQKV